MDKNDASYLRHIVDAIEQLERYTRGMSESEFASRVMVQDASARQVGIVSQAARNISMEFQDLHPKIPWETLSTVHSQIIGEDYKLKLPTALEVIQDDLPPLKHILRKLLSA
ncbi:MAG: HepT-like ribonuclease domain-containing protein [Chloroflexota bacterium]